MVYLVITSGLGIVLAGLAYIPYRRAILRHQMRVFLSAHPEVVDILRPALDRNAPLSCLQQAMAEAETVVATDALARLQAKKHHCSGIARLPSSIGKSLIKR